jgi:hypothetical protein
MTHSHRSIRALAPIAVISILGLFIAAPTPGNVGGCSSSAGSERITGGDAGNPMETAEYMYFDRGLCSYFCERLRECVDGQGVPAICKVVANPPDHCDANNTQVFAQCVRGQLRPEFLAGVGTCPHSCMGAGTFTGAYAWDVQACGDAVLTRTCDAAMLVNNQASPSNAIGAVLLSPPNECLNVCR